MISWSYIAGFFDAEGYIGFHNSGKGGLSPKIQITQSRRLVLDLLSERLLSDGIVAKIRFSKDQRSKLGGHFQLQTSSADSAIRFMQATLPYLFVKRSLAEDTLRFCRIFPKMSSGTVARRAVRHFRKSDEKLGLGDYS